MNDLPTIFKAQRQAFRTHPYPSASERRAHLSQLEALLKKATPHLIRAVSQDFGGRSSHETRLLELFPCLEAIRHARRHLAHWMKTEAKPVSIWFQPGSASLFKQPLGVVGIIAPWNYPLYLTIGPLVSALAAGNRAIIKMSEFTPETGRVLADAIADIFAEEHIAVVNGGPDVAQALTALPLDHLLFTGSTAVGKLVMQAAAKNLTPVTLELGGKSPAIIAPDFSIDLAAQRILLGKCLNAGQTCIAPDYLLLPEAKQKEFIALAQRTVTNLYPDLAHSEDYTAIVNDKHYQRLQNYLQDARSVGAVVHPLAQTALPGRKIAPTLVTKVSDDMLIMQEEIFGPLLPLIPYRTLDEALRYVNERPRPLALYYFDDDRARCERVLAETVAGGVTLNDTILHIAQDELPFGGVGASGMGHYHGRAGFDTFSKLKGVYRQTRYNTIPLLKPPFGRLIENLLKLMLR